MSVWPQLSPPIFAGDNFSIAKALSAATVGRPPAVPRSRPAQPLPSGATPSYDHGGPLPVIPYDERRG